MGVTEPRENFYITTMMAATSGIFFLTCIALTVANSTVDKSCPESAVKSFGDTKFFRIKNHRCFVFVNYDKVEFKDARKKCKINGGSLAMPKTKEINDFLIQEMKKYFGNSPLWIGMHDTVEEGKMVWEDGTDVQDWGNFDGGNGEFFGNDEDCVALDPKNKKWHDYGCFQEGFLALNDKLGFICEYWKMKDGGDKTQRGGGTTGQGNQSGDDSGQGDQAGDDSGQGGQGGGVGDDAKLMEKDKCPTFDCGDLDCGMDGYKIEDGCQFCECNE